MIQLRTRSADRRGVGLASALLLLLSACGSSGAKAAPTTPVTTSPPVAGSTTSTTAMPPPDDLPPATPTAVGAPKGSPTIKSIGPAGGIVATEDGRFSVTVPPGALSADTSISIQPTENTAPEGLGASYHLMPDGQVFQQPVQLSLVYTDDEVDGSAPEALGIAFQDDKGMWEWQPSVTVDPAAHRLGVATTHFSTWSGIPGLQLRPKKASVKLNKQVTLYPAVCTRPAGTVVFAGECVTAPHSAGRPGTLIAGSWAVNGAPRGTTAFGLVAGDSGSGVYTAPSKKPARPTVAVSAQAVSASGKTVLLVSNVTIIGGGYRVKGTVKATDSPVMCPGAITPSISDTVEFSVTPGDDGTLKVVDIKNTASIVEPPKLPVEVPGLSVSYVSAPELFDATSGGVAATNEQVTISLTGTATIGTCKFSGVGVTIPPGAPIAASAGTSFEVAGFVNGQQKGKPDPNLPWDWTITEE
jgi:hypothetical protein